MANNCYYKCRAVAKDEEVLNEFIGILRYKDPKKRWVPRTFSVEVDTTTKDGEFFAMEFYGDVAWSILSCWSDSKSSYYNDIMRAKEARDNGQQRVFFDDKVIQDARDGKVKNIPILCKELGIALEGWSEEEGCEFQEHFTCTHDGRFHIESVHWSRPWNEEKDEYDEEEGGYPDYGDWKSSDVIWNGDVE